MANGWTLERRRNQAALISKWRPWEQSTGPKTEQGKSIVANNAWRGGHRTRLKYLSKMVDQEMRRVLGQATMPKKVADEPSGLAGHAN
jgi:hypothetical protein